MAFTKQRLSVALYYSTSTRPRRRCCFMVAHLLRGREYSYRVVQRRRAERRCVLNAIHVRADQSRIHLGVAVLTTWQWLRRRAIFFGGVVRLSQVLGLGAVEMRAFDCMRRVRAREVVARAYGDAGIRCADRTARR
eukprot:scaffold92556_cov63-Phaeocystis_antarctica.AAC.2